MGSIPELGRSPGKRNCNPLQYSCPGKLHGQRSLAGCSPWGHKSQAWLSIKQRSVKSQGTARQTVPRTAGFTYLFATDSKRAKSCSGRSVCGSQSIAFRMMSTACMFHRGSRGTTDSSGLRNKREGRLLELNPLSGKSHCFTLITQSLAGEEKRKWFNPWQFQNQCIHLLRSHSWLEKN